jgi:hypothetical protein
MSLFKKVMIIGLATMALGSAAMGKEKDPALGSTEGQKKECTQSSLQQAPKPLDQKAVLENPVGKPVNAGDAS